MSCNIKSAKDLDQQIEILKERGLIIEDESKAKEQLLDIGYFRLGFFMFPFEQTYPKLSHRDHILKEGITFDDIIELYYFDCDLRNILIKYLNRIEVNIRTFISYSCTIKYSDNPHWFVDKKIMNKSFIYSFDSAVYKRMLKNPVIERHHTKYTNDKYAPAWKTLEFITLGGIKVLYDNIRNGRLKFKIARKYGCNDIDIFSQYLKVIKDIRNACAHGSCIYNTALSKRIGKGPAYSIYNETTNDSNIKGAISIILHFVGCISADRKVEMENELKTLLSKSRGKNVDQIIELCTNYTILAK